MRRRLLVAAALWLAAIVVMRTVAVPAEHCPAPSAPALETSARAAAEWIGRAQRADGTYVYEYDRATGALTADYNEVRHAGVTMSLYQYLAGGEAAGTARAPARVDPQLLAVADRGLAWMQANLVVHGDRAALAGGPGQDGKLGATALMLAGLVQRRLATGDPSHDELMHALARGVIAQQEPNGGLLDGSDRRTGRPVPGERSLYSIGEAFWALTLMHEVFPGRGYDVPARRVAEYIATTRDTELDVRHPPWADQWAAYGFAEMADWGLDAAEVAYLRRLIERFGFLVRSEAQRDGGGIGGFVRHWDARGAGFGTIVEAMGSFWRLTAIAPQLADLHAVTGERLDCAAGLLVEWQQTPADAARYRDPGLVEGAWFTDDVTRMDDVQHPLSGLLRAEARARERDG